METFKFHISWFEVLKEYPDKVRLEVYEAVISHFLGTEKNVSSPESRALLLFILNDIKADEERLETLAKRNRENGKKGGRPKNPTKPKKPTGLLKETQNNPKNPLGFDDRKKEFYNSLVPFLKDYDRKMIRDFFDYWSEPNKSKSKMKWELNKTWDLKLRLIRWHNNNKPKKEDIGVKLTDNSKDKYNGEEGW
jgi:hypothetical protein